MGRLAIGTAHGFGLVDYAQKKTVFTKCTLVHAGKFLCVQQDDSVVVAVWKM